MNKLAVNKLFVKQIAGNRGANKKRGTRYGKGNNGQNARHPVKLGFNGSTIPFWKRFPKIGSMTNSTFHLYGTRRFQELDLSQFINKMDRVESLRLIRDEFNRPMIHTLDLFQSNILHKLVPTVILNGKPLKKPFHFVCQRISEGALKNIEQAGGAVTLAYHTKVGLSQLHKRYYLHYQQNQPELYLLHQLRKYTQVPPNFLVPMYQKENGYLNKEACDRLPNSGLYISYKQQHREEEKIDFKDVLNKSV